jgi:hypothetical protein
MLGWCGVRRVFRQEIRIRGPVEESAAEGLAVVEPMEVPHFLQNRADGLTGALQEEQINSSFAPQPSQNEASAGFSFVTFCATASD